MSNYARAGIHDVAAFYAHKFAAPSSSRDYYRCGPLHRHAIENARSRWFDRHVRGGSRVLDFGCGSGTLAFLKEKGCSLFGVEMSAEGAAHAEATGYEQVFVGELETAPFPPREFDYVVSADVFGHIEFEDKDAVIRKLKHFLSPSGTMLHAIECGDIDYDAMSDAELQRFVDVDGHVAIEPRSRILARFGRFFAHVDGEARFIHTVGVDDYLKTGLHYGNAHPPEVLAYLGETDPLERRAFHLAAGLAFHSLELRHVPSDDHSGGGLLLLRASDGILDTMEYERPPDPGVTLRPGESLPLDDPAAFLSGWYAFESMGQESWRWQDRKALLQLEAEADVTAIEVVGCFADPEPGNRLRVSESGGGAVIVSPDATGQARAVLPLRTRSLPGRLTLGLETNKVFVPSWDNSPDERHLGFRLTRCTAWREPPAVPRPDDGGPR